LITKFSAILGFVDIERKVAIVTQLQEHSQEVFSTVIEQINIGTNEVEIAELIRVEFQKRGITEFWYDVPINVLIGAERIKIGTTTTDYSVKNPSPHAFLQEGAPLFVDVHPIDSATKLWGDWASTVVFKPGLEKNDEDVKFLQEFREIHLEGISHITSQSTGAQVAKYYIEAFQKNDIMLLDVRDNLGHSMHEGPKENTKRVWLDLQNATPLGEGIFTLEPGGMRLKKNGKNILIARFEECIYLPKSGNATIVGGTKETPFYV
jgi:Xaa-Pro aminopeptidase